MSLRIAQAPQDSTPADARDETLIQRLRQGDDAAGAELVRRYHQVLLRYLQRLCGADQLAEEIHQQTWLSALEHLDRFDPAAGSGGFKAWLFRIATNKANDHWRAAGRERAAKDGLRLIVEREEPDAGYRLEGTEQAMRLKQAIARLPENQRQVLLLRYYGNLKFVQIAEILGCPLNTALGRMHKAMRRLKRMMDADSPALRHTGNDHDQSH